MALPPLSSSDHMTLIIMGKIARPHGVRGEVRVQLTTDFPELLLESETVYLGHTTDTDSADAVDLESIRHHQDGVLIKFAHVNDRNQAELLRGLLVMLPFDAFEPLDNGEFYYFQLIGMAVHTVEGEYLGDVTNILETGANNVFILNGGPRGEILIPDTEEVVRSIEGETRQITITPIPGLLPDPATEPPDHPNDD